jgi:hypothetical protein
MIHIISSTETNGSSLIQQRNGIASVYSLAIERRKKRCICRQDHPSISLLQPCPNRESDAATSRSITSISSTAAPVAGNRTGMSAGSVPNARIARPLCRWQWSPVSQCNRASPNISARRRWLPESLSASRTRLDITERLQRCRGNNIAPLLNEMTGFLDQQRFGAAPGVTLATGARAAMSIINRIFGRIDRDAKHITSCRCRKDSRA